MNKIWKVVTAYFVLPASFLCATSQEAQDETQNSCCCVKKLSRYFDMGVEGSIEGKNSLDLALLVGIGHRAQKDHHGLEVYGAIGSSGRKAIARLNVLYNYFFYTKSKEATFCRFRA